MSVSKTQKFSVGPPLYEFSVLPRVYFSYFTLFAFVDENDSNLFQNCVPDSFIILNRL